MPDRPRRPVARRKNTRGETKLAQRRLQFGLTQQEMSDMTGISLRTYRRLEQGEIDNPPLRYLVNCATVLQTSLLELVEDSWLEWLQLGEGPQSPPKTPWRARAR